MIWNDKKSSNDIDWEDFSLPVTICNAAKRANPPCNLDQIVAKAKSLLSGHSMWNYTKNTNFNILSDREDTLARELAQVWKKKYSIQKKKQDFIAQKVEEELISKAFKNSSRSKKAKKASKSLNKKLSGNLKGSNTPKPQVGHQMTVKNKSNASLNFPELGTFLPSLNSTTVQGLGAITDLLGSKKFQSALAQGLVSIDPVPSLSALKKMQEQAQKQTFCKLCSGAKQLSDGSKTYPCPACSNVEAAEKISKKKVPLKDQPKPGERKLKF